MRIRKYLVLSLAALALSAGSVSNAATTATSPDHATVRARVNVLRDAVNRRDATAAAALWTLDGTYLDEEGNRFTGRDALQKMFAQVFADNPAQANAQLDIENIRYVRNDVAIVDGTVRAGGNRTNRFSLTLTRSGEEWLISSATETPVIGGPAANSQPLNSLSWLIGKWHAERDGKRVDMDAEWIADKHFILCHYDVQKNPQSHEIEGQVIGWDPRTDQPISWHFNSDGGFGRGVWQRTGANWAIYMIATAHDGSTFTAVNTLSGLSKDGFTWQSEQRSRDGMLLSDTAPIKVERTSK